MLGWESVLDDGETKLKRTEELGVFIHVSLELDLEWINGRHNSN
jgi:hypothetical protein